MYSLIVVINSINLKRFIKKKKCIGNIARLNLLPQEAGNWLFTRMAEQLN